MLIHRVFIFATVVLVGACTFGAAEFKVYDQAFEIQYIEGEKVLDQVAAGERVLVEQQFSRSRGIRAFDPDEARYYLKLGDPPLTGSLRASLAALKDYNDALSGLATGEAAASLRTELASANSALTSSLGALASATGVDGEFITALSGHIGRVLPLLARIIHQSSDFKVAVVA